MATNNFKAFGIGAGANVTSQADYEALSALATGFQSGKASSAQINKALRQSTVMAAMLGQFINAASLDALDNANLSTLLANFLSSLTTNLSLGNASKRTVGTAANNIPDMNSFASSLVAGGGYQKLPGGLIIQWGNGVYANQATTLVTLPIAFPNAGFLAISCKGASLTLSGEYIVGSQIASLSTINITNTGGTSGGTKGIYWIALGY
ncbi:hypothetical protein ACCX84_03845 [Pantoea trifolii]|uniref:gp53-like domain-containing protein n=1 Tax=Pantoea trifolii TaxID=2968030 RepID=UPI003EDAB6AB